LNKTNQINDNQQDDIDKDNPIVALEPEDNFKQASVYMGSKKYSQLNQSKNNGTSSGNNASLYL
jgi:hypothetical protein